MNLTIMTIDFLEMQPTQQGRMEIQLQLSRIKTMNMITHLTQTTLRRKQPNHSGKKKRKPLKKLHIVLQRNKTNERQIFFQILVVRKYFKSRIKMYNYKLRKMYIIKNSTSFDALIYYFASGSKKL